MQPNKTFLGKESHFWALVKYASGELGYSDRKSEKMKRYEDEDIVSLPFAFLAANGILADVIDYLNYRSDVLETYVVEQLMNREQAKKALEALLKTYKPKCKLTYNKQKNEKRHHNYLTCLVNIIAEKHFKEDFDSNPRDLCVMTDNKQQVMYTFSRWMDGVYPRTVNPKAMWEIKEYYGTTTFGSRVADGVYETLLDGYEINEAEIVSKKGIEHYLFVDDYFTWWKKGKSYLCRLIDMMHQGFVDEVIFGKEVLTRWPEIVKNW